MRKNAGLKSREEMAELLESGTDLYYLGSRLYYDTHAAFKGESPFRVQYKSRTNDRIYKMWNQFSKMEIEVDWRDELEESKRKICWVSDLSASVKSHIGIIEKYIINKNGEYFYIDIRGGGWVYATPVVPEDL